VEKEIDEMYLFNYFFKVVFTKKLTTVFLHSKHTSKYKMSFFNLTLD